VRAGAESLSEKKENVDMEWAYEPLLFFFFFFFLLFRAVPSAYGSSQVKGQIRAIAAGLHHSHSNTGSKLHLRLTP